MHVSSQAKPIATYQAELAKYHTHDVTHESALRTAFHNLLAAFSSQASNGGWTLIPEEPLPNGKIPDGTLRDSFNLRRGFWEAKDTKDDIEQEIRKKIAIGYPTTNTIFEDTSAAILYQDGKRQGTFDLRKPQEIADLLTAFFNHTEPHIEEFHRAVDEFKERIPDLASRLTTLITTERAQNRAFQSAFASFFELCQKSIDPNITEETVDEMLVQHLLTERLFRTIFDNPDFTQRNAIAVEIEKVIAALTSRAFNRAEFMRSLDRYYVAIETEARTVTDWSEKQHFLNTVYERFFQGFSTRQADTHGIVYTPQEIVDFMCASVEEVLQSEFGTSLSEPGVQILDPATGTGNFIVNLLRRISGSTLEQKYTNDLFANEIMLLPYYIASLNIEHAYYERTNKYLAFNGICFTDTLDLAESRQMSMFAERNTKRVEREKEAKIMVVIGNPPYNVGQESENDNNKNRKYPVIDTRIRETYAKDSKATNKNALSDAYVKFFRWATDRLQGRDGIVCLVSNNGFLNGLAFDGFRKHALQDFTRIYHLDFKGNARTSGERRRAEGGNIFNDQIRTGIGITVLVRSTQHEERSIYYHSVGDYWTAQQKVDYLRGLKSVGEVPWQLLVIDENHNWLVENLPSEFSGFLPLGTQAAKATQGNIDVSAIFKVYSRGAETTRDTWVYDFEKERVAGKVRAMIETYNAEVSRWVRAGSPRDIDNFVLSDETKIKWSSRLKEHFVRKTEAKFDETHVRCALYRPFAREYLYFDPILTHRQGMFPNIFPTPATETENIVIWLKVGSVWPMFALATNIIPDLLPQGGSQCFPLYTYAEDGSARAATTSPIGRWRSSARPMATM